MNKRFLIGGLLISALLAACSKRETPPAQSATEQPEAIAAEGKDATGTAAFDACKLLTNEEIASIQGEAPAKSQLVGQSDGPLSVSQCNFLLPTGWNSMAVRVVERGKGTQARDPKEVWQETFHNIPPHVETARKARKPQKVDGVGEEAFWLGDVKSGGLHVLKGNRYIRVNVGGPREDLNAKIAKCSRVAELVLPRLDAGN